MPIRTVTEHGTKDKRSVAFALDWPGWSRGAKTARQRRRSSRWERPSTQRLPTSSSFSSSTGSCDLVNLYLADLQGFYLPKGPAWMVELFCETGVPRHYAFVAIDPFTGAVRGVDNCDVECVRVREMSP